MKNAQHRRPAAPAKARGAAHAGRTAAKPHVAREASDRRRSAEKGPAGARKGGAAPKAAKGRTKPQTDAAAFERAGKRREALLAFNNDVRRAESGTGKKRRAKGASRHAKAKRVGIVLHPLAKSLLDEIAALTGETLQALGVEAFNLLLTAYGRKPVA